MKKTFFAVATVAACLAGSAVQAEESLAAGGYEFKFDAPWKSVTPTSSMRAGQLQYDHEDEKLTDIDMAFFVMGGGVQANIDRWKGQFVGEAEFKTEEREVNGKKVTYFVGKGNFMDSMGGGPFSGNKVEKPDTVMLAAILPGEGGRLVFLKLTGPRDSVDPMEASFYEVVESALK